MIRIRYAYADAVWICLMVYGCNVCILSHTIIHDDDAWWWWRRWCMLV